MSWEGKKEELLEQIHVCPSPHEKKSVVRLFPYQQPVGLHVTFPRTGHGAGQPVRPIAWVERLLRQELFNESPEFVEIPSSPLNQPHVSPELTRRIEAHAR